MQLGNKFSINSQVGWANGCIVCPRKPNRTNYDSAWAR